MSSRVSVKGSLYVQDTEGGLTTDNIPFEIYSDYSVADPATYFRQLHFSNIYMGISNVGTYFYISEPSTSAMSEQSNTFIITSDGNVGIGKTDPADRLHVEGETLVRGSIGNFTSATVSDNIHTSNVVIGDGKLVVGVNPNHRIPKGTIALWENSTESTIPKGWSLYSAIGTRFVRGGNTPEQESGSDSVTLVEDNFLSHTHTTNNVTYAPDSTHNHDTSSTVTGGGGNHSHAINYNVEDASYTGHTHFLLEVQSQQGNVFYTINNFNTTSRYRNKTQTFTSSTGYTSHNHNVGSPNKALGSTNISHTHNVAGLTFGNSGWIHAKSSTNKTYNSTNSNNYTIIPKHKSYVFIIKQ